MFFIQNSSSQEDQLGLKMVMELPSEKISTGNKMKRAHSVEDALYKCIARGQDI